MSKTSNSSLRTGRVSKVAQILSEARATLEEPSRPYTPQARFEQKIALDSNASRNFSVNSRLPQRRMNDLLKSIEHSKSINIEEKTTTMRICVDEPSEQISLSTTKNDSQSLKMIFNDIIDIASSLEVNTSADSTLVIILSSLQESVETMTKTLRKDPQIITSGA